MRGVGRWGVRPVMPQALLLALHLRDAAGLHPPTSPAVPDLPPLDPPVRPAATLPGAEEAGRQWARWWAGAFPGGPESLTSLLPPTFPGLRGMPELRGVAELGIDEAVAWTERARHLERRVLADVPVALFETTLLTRVERELGRRLRSFTLDVVVLPVRGAGAWETPAGPVISLALRADRDAYLAWLREQLLRAGGTAGRTRTPPPEGAGPAVTG
ncbi:hypothetical protein MN205_15250 [Kineococcus sp. TRM81007]|uniref:hypothetical protein n=1 Tax=Kineococcus sp. TRM81007 TaxID=2925831 RepID=UPI001F59642A|nr:hypothetical protein [Kineococcus sp. TRM81007]MCI2239834.1 hypothetical protein [Kineococcus sp. TRM81007]